MNLFKFATNGITTIHSLLLICLGLESNVPLTIHCDNEDEDFWVTPAGNSISSNGYSDEVLKVGVEWANNNILNSFSIELRIIAAHLFKGLWESGNEHQKETVLMAIKNKVFCEINKYGTSSLQLISLVIYFGQVIKDNGIINEIMKEIISAGYKAMLIIRNHENNRTYQFIQRMVKSTEDNIINFGFNYCLEIGRASCRERVSALV